MFWQSSSPKKMRTEAYMLYWILESLSLSQTFFSEVFYRAGKVSFIGIHVVRYSIKYVQDLTIEKPFI